MIPETLLMIPIICIYLGLLFWREILLRRMELKLKRERRRLETLHSLTCSLIDHLDSPSGEMDEFTAAINAGAEMGWWPHYMSGPSDPPRGSCEPQATQAVPADPEPEKGP